MKIKTIPYDFSVCKIKYITGVNFNDEFCFLGEIDEEISLVCMTEHVPDNTVEREDDWKVFRIQRALDFSYWYPVKNLYTTGRQ